MPKLLPARMLDPEGQPDGQVATIVSGRAAWAAPTGGGGGGASAFGWFNVMDPAYGAVNDNSTDDTAAINAAIAALNTAGRGLLYFPAGIGYKTTASLTPITAICTVLGDGPSKAMTFAAPTQITTTLNNAPILTVNGHATTVRGIGFKCVSGSTPAAGSTGILVTAGDGCRYEDLSFERFYIDMDVQDGSEWYMQQCFFYDPVKYGLKIQHIDLTDGGDQSIVGCQFIAGNQNCDAAIRQESGGGLKLDNTKFNMRSSHQFFVGLDIAVVAPTGVLTVHGCSFENLGDRAIKGSGVFQSVSITGNQFGDYATKHVPSIEISGWKDVTITGNTFMNTNGCTAPAIQLTSVEGLAVGLNSYRGFTQEYVLTTCSAPINIITANSVPSSRIIGSGTGLTGGGDLTADRTLAIDTSAEAERIRDVIGAALVQGPGVVVTVDDAGDSITVGVGSIYPLTTVVGGVPQLVFDSDNRLVYSSRP